MGISREQALDCFGSHDLVGIGMEADAVRRRLHPEGVVGYTMVGAIDCAGLSAEDKSGAVNTSDAALEAVRAAVDKAVAHGASGVRLLHCANPERIVRLLKAIRRQSPELWVEALSPAEVVALAVTLGLSVPETLARLIDAGLSTIAAHPAELLYLASPGSLPAAEWIEVHRAAHTLGMRTVASLVFGAGETAVQRVDFFEALRRLQNETGGFAAFVPVAAPAPGGRELDGVTAIERLKTLAIARMFLDSIENVQASATSSGLKVLQTELRFGANDAGAVDPRIAGSEEDMRRIIRNAGFRPAERALGYSAMLVT